MPTTRQQPRAPVSSAFDPDCEACPRLAAFLAQVRRTWPQYHARPVPPFGDAEPALLIVGLAPGLHGANATGRPFTGDFAGELLYKTLFEFGFSSHPASLHARDELCLRRCRITNAVKCVPPGNKPLGAEVAACNGYLREELRTLAPHTLILALGTVAHGAVLRALALRAAGYKFGHGRLHQLPDGRRLLDSYHCSRYNTQTGRLTSEMFRAVFREAVRLLGEHAPAPAAPDRPRCQPV
jgi:uracil-DNA glycosylase